MSMPIDKLLKQAGASDDREVLCQILANRINHGSERGGMVSVAQFCALADDIKAWHEWANARDAASVTDAASHPSKEPHMTQKTTPTGKAVYAVPADGVSPSGHQLYTIHDEPVAMADNWKLLDSEQSAQTGVDGVASEGSQAPDNNHGGIGGRTA
jgi:hypothetical protein